MSWGCVKISAVPANFHNVKNTHYITKLAKWRASRFRQNCFTVLSVIEESNHSCSSSI